MLKRTLNFSIQPVDMTSIRASTSDIVSWEKLCGKQQQSVVVAVSYVKRSFLSVCELAYKPEARVE